MYLVTYGKQILNRQIISVYESNTVCDLIDMAINKLEPSITYLDVKNNDWFYGVVQKATMRGLMGKSGSGNYFEPNSNMSRGMVATVLYRMEGAPKVSYGKYFRDVLNNQWYSDAILWASREGIISGYNLLEFGPDDPVTREQLAVMLRNYAKYRGKNTNSNLSLDSFIDNKNITAYAKSAMQWAAGNNIITGSVMKNGKYLNPTKNATRGECAKMFTMLQNLLIK